MKLKITRTITSIIEGKDLSDCIERYSQGENFEEDIMDWNSVQDIESNKDYTDLWKEHYYDII